MKKPIRPQRSWEDLGREDAQSATYRPPTNSDRARQCYQFGWEEAARGLRGLPRSPQSTCCAACRPRVSPRLLVGRLAHVTRAGLTLPST